MKTKIELKSIMKIGIIVPMLSVFAITVHAQEKGKPWPAPESAIKMKNPVAVTDENITEGKALYAKHCKSCHGTKGKGDGSKAANLDISCGDFTSEAFKNETDGAIYWKTTEGRDPMPTFKKKVSDEERWTIINYIRTLGSEKKK